MTFLSHEEIKNDFHCVIIDQWENEPVGKWALKRQLLNQPVSLPLSNLSYLDNLPRYIIKKKFYYLVVLF